jgi:hypothetical protein
VSEPYTFIFVEHEPGERLSNGDPAGIGGRTSYGVGVTQDGIHVDRLTPRFNHPRKAAAYARLVEHRERDAA